MVHDLVVFAKLVKKKKKKFFSFSVSSFRQVSRANFAVFLCFLWLVNIGFVLCSSPSSGLCQVNGSNCPWPLTANSIRTPTLLSRWPTLVQWLRCHSMHVHNWMNEWGLCCLLEKTKRFFVAVHHLCQTRSVACLGSAQVQCRRAVGPTERGRHAAAGRRLVARVVGAVQPHGACRSRRCGARVRQRLRRPVRRRVQQVGLLQHRHAPLCVRRRLCWSRLFDTRQRWAKLVVLCCLTARAADTGACPNDCSGPDNGVCELGVCQCADGRHGVDCSLTNDNPFSGDVVIGVLIGVFACVCILGAVVAVCRASKRWRGSRHCAVVVCGRSPTSQQSERLSRWTRSDNGIWRRQWRKREFLKATL